MADKLLEQIAESPAVLVEETIETAKILADEVFSKEPLRKAKRYWHMLGPGLTTGAADDDPSGIATYSQTGAAYGFQLLWLAGFTLPFMAVVQEMCARIGLVTGRGLAANIRIHFSKRLLYLCASLLLIANSINIGADLGAMAKGVQLLAPGLNFGLLVVSFAGLSLLLQIFTTYERYASILKYLALILFAYVLSAFTFQMDWAQVLRGAVLPTIQFSKAQLFLICGILGTTISPYLFFWQTSQEVEEEIMDGRVTLEERQASTPREIRTMRIDVWSGMFVSNLVMFFIIAVCAATLFANGLTNITTASEAASALKPLAGDGAYLLFAIGIIGTGLLAVPVLAGSAAYAVSESFRWKTGLYRKLKDAYAFYGIIIFSMLIGLAINFIGLDPIKALLYTAVLNGLIAPLILALIVIISSSEKVMGKRKNNFLTKTFGWTITAIMIVAGLAAVSALVIG